jgi:hypothetical protein
MSCLPWRSGKIYQDGQFLAFRIFSKIRMIRSDDQPRKGNWLVQWGFIYPIGCPVRVACRKHPRLPLRFYQFAYPARGADADLG